MSVMNGAGGDSCSWQGDEICLLYHFLERMDGAQEVEWSVGGIPREVWRSRTGESKANGALT